MGRGRDRSASMGPIRLRTDTQTGPITPDAFCRWQLFSIPTSLPVWAPSHRLLPLTTETTQKLPAMPVTHWPLQLCWKPVHWLLCVWYTSMWNFIMDSRTQGAWWDVIAWSLSVQKWRLRGKNGANHTIRVWLPSWQQHMIQLFKYCSKYKDIQ